jgi:hypothetical protein
MNPNEDNENFPPAKFKGQFSDDFESEMMLQKLFGQKTNQSRASTLRDIERELLKTSTPPVNIRDIPLADRARFDQEYVTVPDEIKTYLANAEFPLTEDEINMLQDKMETHHRVESPSYIVLMPDFARTGKNHVYIDELEAFRTGFEYNHQ